MVGERTASSASSPVSMRWSTFGGCWESSEVELRSREKEEEEEEQKEARRRQKRKRRAVAVWAILDLA